MTLTHAQERLGKVANMIPAISENLEVGSEDTHDSIVTAVAYLNSILKAVDSDTIDYLA